MIPSHAESRDDQLHSEITGPGQFEVPTFTLQNAFDMCALYWHGLTIQACGATDQRYGRNCHTLGSSSIPTQALHGGISRTDARTFHIPFISIMPILAIQTLNGGIPRTDARTFHIPFISIMPVLATQALNGGISSTDARTLNIPNISHSLTPIPRL
ncbi:hypothetical protein CY34DRAFT_806361 [Suillus luteus UH-Slu-Lm8-n1]|uniref:Uncharacterized protein n=1 Tax=Suillus luteus UH-Slu-Lm8-n1 TaxID=930992 RepID=A0A0C9ZTG0_9AGAM|nr:hypothetical protein CY34DRAFT_806361 [Suillus luteus UH-Slu-Lm8-n1]